MHDINNRNILIIDPNFDEISSLNKLLIDFGFNVSSALDGLQGYARALTAEPDLILSEVDVPKIDGLALLRRFKAHPFIRDVPILFISKRKEDEVQLLALREGAVDYIIKPFSTEQVLRRIQIHLKYTNFENHSYSKFGKDLKSGLSESQILVQAAHAYSRGRLDNPPKLSQIADALNVKKHRLNNAFQECVGMTVFEYERQLRMQTAKQLLRETELDIVTIALSVGFSNPANFSTAFRKYTGSTPSAYRKATS